MSEKYILRTETNTLYFDNITQREEFVYVEDTGILYRILEDDEMELQPDALLDTSDNSEKQKRLCQYGHFQSAEKAFHCVEYNKAAANEMLEELKKIDAENKDKQDNAEPVSEINETPKTYTASYLFNYFGGDHVGDKLITGVGFDVAFRPYKDNKLVQFRSEKETYFYVEKKSRLIGVRRTAVYITDAVKVSFDRDELVKLTRNEDLIRIICDHFGWNRLDIEIVGYELDYAETKWMSAPWYCGKDICIKFMEEHKDDLDNTDNRSAQCPAYGWLEE